MKNLLLQSLIYLFASISLLPQNNGPVGINKKFDPSKGVKIGSNYVLDKNQSLKAEEKISPLLHHVVSKIQLQKKQLKKIDADDFIKNNPFIAIKKGEYNEIYLPVFIKTTNIEISSADISAVGGKVQTIAGDIITAEIPADYVYDLTRSSEIRFIEASSKSKPLLNESHKEISADLVHSGSELLQAYKGNGVVVGVLDSGVDWQHEDFQNASGNRIQYLWDMSSSGQPPNGFDYGTEYTKAHLDANNCQETDGDDGGGHGTHVTGTAAGNGNAMEGYTGIAPESDIVFVKGFRNGPGFADVDVVNGCNYIFSKASQLGKPSVINLSLGGHSGAHDGTSLYEQALSNLTGEGKIIVAAAGNEGGSQIHVGYTASGSSLDEVSQTVWVIPEGASVSVVDMWYNTGNIYTGIAAYNSNLELIGYTDPVQPGQKIENIPFEVDGITYGVITIDATTTSNPNNGAKEVFFVIDSNQGQLNLNAVYWVLYTFGSGDFDAWQLTDSYFTSDSDPQNKIIPGDNNNSVGTPATALKLICVGSYVTKNQWIDINGQNQIQSGNPTIGQISSFSSLGPTRDGRMKPDISAPGEVIVAAYSSNLTATPGSNILQGGKLQKLQGTSMATPHVAGVVALMLQAKPSLDYTEALSILKSTARKDNFTTQNPNNTYGEGKLDAYNAVKAVAGTGGGGQTIILQEGFDSAFLPANWTAKVTSSGNTWVQGNPQNNNFNLIDPNSTNSAIIPFINQDQDEWIITSSFSLGTGTSSLEFYAGYSTQWLSAATINLHISTDGGNNWNQLWTAENDGQPWSWRKKVIDLSAFSGKSNLKLGWQYIGNDGDLAGLDGIKLTGVSSTTDVSTDNTVPLEFNLLQNYPNPFNPTTNFEFRIPDFGFVSLKVFDVLGNEVSTLLNEDKAPGVYTVTFDATGLSSGVYFYRIEAGSFNQVRKMILMK